MRTHVACLIALFLGVVATTPVSAASKPGPCAPGESAPKIPGFVAAEVIEKPRPYYPDRAIDEWSEGWLHLEFSVATDGSVRDIAVADAIGAKEFVIQSVNTLSRWRFKPAMRNGVPVEQHLCGLQVTFLFVDSARTADHNTFVQHYNGARQLVQAGKYDEAIAMMEPALRKRLNLYELAMGSFVLGLAHAKKNDWANALFHTRHAVIEDLYYLEKPMQSLALVMLIELEIRAGNMTSAFKWLERLQEVDPQAARPDGPSAKMVARVRDALAAPGPIAIAARLARHPLIDAPAVWRHPLLRSKFVFQEISGQTTSFRLRCTGATFDAAVDDQTRWDVPPEAGPCMLRVEGAPGTTFKLIEEQAPSPTGAIGGR